MKQTTTLKPLLLAATLVAGFGTAARADDSLPPADQPAPITSDVSLLGLSHATLTYSYINLDGTSVHADDYTFEFNQPLAANLDGVFAYDYAQTSVVAGSRLKTQTLSAALRAFSTAYSWGKPYAEAGVGYARSRLAGNSDDSFVWSLGVGAELRVSSRATVTPYISYVDAPDLDSGGVFNFGARGSYWINTSWAATVGFEVDDDKNTAFTVGTNFRF